MKIINGLNEDDKCGEYSRIGKAKIRQGCVERRGS